MGRDKAELPLRGKRLIEWQAEKFRDLGVREILLSGAGHICPGTRTVPDIYPGRGPLGGLHACLGEASTPHCLVLSADVPLVPRAALEALMEHHLKTGAEVTILRHGGRWEPLMGVYESALADRIAPLITERSRPVMALLDGVHTEIMPWEDDPAAFLNCNTPEAYEALKLVLA